VLGIIIREIVTREDTGANIQAIGMQRRKSSENQKGCRLITRMQVTGRYGDGLHKNVANIQRKKYLDGFNTIFLIFQTCQSEN